MPAKDGVILSMMFDDTNGTESTVFSHFGIPSAKGFRVAQFFCEKGLLACPAMST